MPTTDYSQTTRTKNLAAKEISKFHLLNPTVYQGGRYNFNESSRLLQGLGDVVIRIAASSRRRLPDAPTDVSAVGGDGEATISFTPPVNNGGSPIISYTVTSSPGGFTATSSSSPITVTGLSNGTSYTFSVVATNSVGNSISATTTATPGRVPDAPTSVSAVGDNEQATVSFTPPVNNGGSAITSYTVTTSPGGFTASGSSSPITVTGLTNGTLYTFSLVATNAIGNSTPETTTATPATIPDAPTGVSAVGGNERAEVSFTPPVNNGGSAITSYTVTSNPGGFTASGSSSPITVLGLTNGTPYTFSIIATNAKGNSAPSSSSSPVTPDFVDNIIASLTTSLSAYNSASNDDWVKITLAEYNNLQSNISGSVDVGVSDGYMFTATGGGLANAKSALVANSVTSASPAIPANSYLYGFSVVWRTNPGVGLRVYTNTSTASTTGFNQVGNELPTITTPGILYYVRKGVSTTNGATAGLLGCFTGTKMDYPNANFTGSAGYIGFKVLQNTGITPIPNMRYLLGDGSVPESNSTLSGNLGGYGAFGIQGLATTTKQWV